MDVSGCTTYFFRVSALQPTSLHRHSREGTAAQGLGSVGKARASSHQVGPPRTPGCVGNGARIASCLSRVVEVAEAWLQVPHPALPPCAYSSGPSLFATCSSATTAQTPLPLCTWETTFPAPRPRRSAARRPAALPRRPPRPGPAPRPALGRPLRRRRHPSSENKLQLHMARCCCWLQALRHLESMPARLVSCVWQNQPFALMLQEGCWWHHDLSFDAQIHGESWQQGLGYVGPLPIKATLHPNHSRLKLSLLPGRPLPRPGTFGPAVGQLQHRMAACAALHLWHTKVASTSRQAAQLHTASPALHLGTCRALTATPLLTLWRPARGASSSAPLARASA